jgi:hypothetical protein
MTTSVTRPDHRNFLMLTNPPLTKNGKGKPYRYRKSQQLGVLKNIKRLITAKRAVDPSKLIQYLTLRVIALL